MWFGERLCSSPTGGLVAVPPDFFLNLATNISKILHIFYEIHVHVLKKVFFTVVKLNRQDNNKNFCEDSHCQFTVWSVTAFHITYRVGQKKVSQRSLHITWSNTVRFSKFFHCHILLKIYNKAVIKYPTSPQTCCHTTL